MSILNGQSGVLRTAIQRLAMLFGLQIPVCRLAKRINLYCPYQMLAAGFFAVCRKFKSYSGKAA